jgi:hypothetical protein
VIGRCDNTGVPRHWLVIQALILAFVAAGMIIAITKLA